jgi:hypothetical protein
LAEIFPIFLGSVGRENPLIVSFFSVLTPDVRKKRGVNDDDDGMSCSSNTSSVAEKAKTRKTPAQVKSEAAARKLKVERFILIIFIFHLFSSLSFKSLTGLGSELGIF